jgi:hypothetical protein
MKRQLIILFALVALNANANAETNNDPFTDFLSYEIEKIELEEELFGTSVNNDVVSIDSIEVYELEEELDIEYNTAELLPEGFNAKAGMNDIDWSAVELYEIEEELEIGFETKDYLPEGFNPYRGTTCDDEMIKVSLY